MIGLGRLFRTVKDLKAGQVFHRLRARVPAFPIKKGPCPEPRALVHSWIQPAARKQSLVGQTDFQILNQTFDLKDIGWQGDRASKLWRYNQHYFDDLNAEMSSDRKDWHESIIDNWLRHNPPTAGVAWEPYVASLRTVNFIKWALDGNPLSNQLLMTLAIQARLIRRRPEWHLRGNHLFANAKALLFAGAFFSGAEAEDWHRLGLKILKQEIDEQILPDGGHFELSPMYHSIILEDILDLFNLAATYGLTSVESLVRPKIAPMIEWLECMSHPDGEISFFNDAAFGVAPRKAELFAYADRLGISVTHVRPAKTFLKQSGFVVLRKKNWHVLMDCAEVGPKYIPGHAHADTLSIEVSFSGSRVFVNSGITTYERNDERLEQRGTKMHNTAVLNNTNSSEVWASFRVGRKARPFGLSVVAEPTLSASASHDGYRWLEGRPVHTRLLNLSEEELVVTDSIQSKVERFEINFLVHPEVRVEKGNGHLLFYSEGRKTLKMTVEGGLLNIEKAEWHPEFNKSIRTVRINVLAIGLKVCTRLRRVKD